MTARQIIPAIDLIDGQVVRLYQGDYAKQTQYSLSPLDLAKRYAQAGAAWLHIVDLSGAKTPEKRQVELIGQIAALGVINCQAGGGVRSKEDIQALLDAGVKRVVLGSVAVKQPELVREWLEYFGAEAIVLALDVNITADGRKLVATHGWQQDSGVEITALLESYVSAGVKHVLCTDIACDGTLAGPNQKLYEEMKATFPSIQWQASGGIGNLDHIRHLAASSVDHLILGRALLEGRFSLEEAKNLWEGN
ncbi:1-(5-phosphoribosyl)-5-[(5-phosphoribosylamino)methylideneamino]imidazole-4-carboxamide isomerase [Aliiglaciecola sp. CAU 1673]|uniref:1-(5-phosphoribosyl)-5-[(5- phosphoribosylamino)methylideneamino]imidazole-4- carboxamide isomerase n=1 Tax=Aliiglaciecola sp. CAU 1673 TaxID=3032595 RepID=UPI0023DC9C99|nr:1-(5-phosphoribosyl)-5-[(5-phosphoribosylamino)methylideneamino]imidazole-4-carboxamide isomerase [Aliiglaciecola sp. CAU 1673]MDF2179541.1 1-(5-phosphoribosyl)-5-[(5-phosphoribosylamino)methylideneamino]imidazole-4-carboxamide isomerase [Aliiglaciecola sp. CAU 1673]